MNHFIRFSRFRAALLAPAALLIPLLASCGGGGGGGSSSRSPALDNATPVPVSSSSCSNSTFTPNYADSVSLLHWQRFPLSIHFVQDGEFSAARQEIALAGFNQWVAATGNRADFTLASSATRANIVVSFFKFTGGSGDTLGEATVTFDGNNVIRSAKIRLGITGNNGDDTLTAAHEYGHALGITGHSPRETDLMFFTGNRNGEVTNFDLNTVLTAYCNGFNRSSARTKAAVGPLRTIVIN